MRKLLIMVSILTISASAVAPRVSAQGNNIFKIQLENGNQSVVQQINLANCDIDINELLSKLQSNGRVFDISNPDDLEFLKQCNIDISKLTNGQFTIGNNETAKPDNKDESDTAAKPTQPVAKPTQPVAKPTEPVAKPTEPVAKPTEPVAKPTQPVAKPTQPVTKPTDTVTKPVVDNDKNNNQNLSYIEQVVKLVNEERAKSGLNPVTIDSNLAKAANKRAEEIVTSFSHTRPNGSSFGTVLKEYNVSHSGAGENIAYGQKTPEEVMNGWMNSAGHRANILNAKFTKIGVGYYQSSSGVNYWCQLFAY